MQTNARVWNKALQSLVEIFAADDAFVRQARDRCGQINLQRPLPENAARRRAGSVELMKNCEQFAALLLMPSA
jgi:hypothetical protein